MAIDKVNPMCGCVMPVVPTVFSDGCLTIPEQVGKLTYKVNEVIDQTNINTENVNKALEDFENIKTEVETTVTNYLQENGSPKLKPGAKIDGVTFTGEYDITHAGICATQSNLANKIITAGTGWSGELTAGSIIAVKFSFGSDNIQNGTMRISTSQNYVQVKNGASFEIPAVGSNEYLILHYDGTYLNVVGGGNCAYSKQAGKLTPGNTINGTSFTGENSITIACSTTSAASSNLKIIASGSQSGVALQNGSVILVRFLAGNTAEGAITFKVGDSESESRPVYYNGSTQGLPNLPTNACMLFTYANDSWIGQYVGTGGSGTGGEYILPAASTTTLGGVKIGEGIQVTPDGIISVDNSGSGYVLPVATPSTLGGVKAGDNVTIAADGKLSVNAPYTLPAATASTLGGVKVGANLSVAQDGTLSADAQQYTLPVASSNTLGGVKIGQRLTIQDGVLSADEQGGNYVLPTASSSVKGGIKVGSGLNISNEVLSVPLASTSVAGRVMVGSGLNVSSSGVVSNGYSFNYNSSTKTLNITSN